MTIKDIADIQTGPFGSLLHKEDYVEEGTPIVTVEHLGKRIFTEQNLPEVSDDDKERLNKYVLTEGDIVFSRVGSVDRCSYVDVDHDGWMFSGRCLRVRPKYNIYPLYLYYYFCTEGVKQYIRNIAVGATMPSINTKLLGEVPIELPDYQTQKKIAETLSSIDSKIELNEEINKNLLQQALCLFEEEFVTKADINEKLPLYDFANYINGAAFKPDELGDVGLPVIKIAELKAGITTSTRFFSGDKGIKYLVHNKDILFSWSGNPETSIDLFVWSEGDGVLNQHTFNVKSKYSCPWFTFLMLKYHKSAFAHIASNKQTTGLGHVTVADLKRLTFPFDLNRMNAFETTVTPIMDLFYGNLIENHKLSTLRDTLLPILMSGEIDISDLYL